MIFESGFFAGFFGRAKTMPFRKNFFKKFIFSGPVPKNFDCNLLISLYFLHGNFGLVLASPGNH